MISNSFNPYRQKTVQYQQRNQGQPQQRPHDQGQRQRPHREQRLRDGFDEEWKDKDVEIERVKGQVVEEIRGRVVDISRYWLKLFVDNQVLYLNKAYVLSIKPAEIESEALGGTNGDRKQ